jgi:hypothetical protein
MAPQEVAGLQALAKAHGGSLTTNPDTGLPEAGFLSSLLPTLIGAALAPFTGGLSAALITGAGYTAATGSLKKGLMAGLGAYGGAGLMGGLSSAGTAAAGEGLAGAAGTVNPLAGMEAAALENAAVAPAASVQVGAPIVDVANTSQTGTNLFGNSAADAASIGDAQRFYPAQYPQGAPFAQHPAPINAANIAPTVTPPPQSDFLSGMDKAALENKAVSGFDATNTDAYTNAKRGLSGLMDNPASRDAFMTKMGGGTGLLKTGMMAAAPLLMGDQDQEEYKGSGPNPYEYSYDYRTGSYTRQAPGYRDAQTVTPPRAMADGGPVQAMSDRNEAQTLMANNGQMFADGGYAYSYDPATQSYSQKQAPEGTQGSGIMSSMIKGILGGGPNQYKYSYDPATQSYTQIAAPNADDGMDVNPFYGFSSESGGDGGGASASADASGVGGGMSNSGEGGGAAGEGGWANGGIAALARGGQSHLGDYSDGGRMLRGPGDGVSDDIPATIGGKRPARLADGEFVVPARIVSEIGNGSSEAGARKLYAMMDRVQKARKKSIGKGRVAVNSRAEKLLPA